MRRTNQSFSQLQQALNQIVARQTGELTAQLRDNMQEMGSRVEQSAIDARRTAQQATEVIQSASGLEGARSKRSS